MKIKELLKTKADECTDYEIYKYTTNNKSVHSDYITNIEDDYDKEDLFALEVEDYYIMDEEEYGRTVLANCSEDADFDMWYDDKDAKVLVIIVDDCKVKTEENIERFLAGQEDLLEATKQLLKNYDKKSCADYLKCTKNVTKEIEADIWARHEQKKFDTEDCELVVPITFSTYEYDYYDGYSGYERLLKIKRSMMEDYFVDEEGDPCDGNEIFSGSVTKEYETGIKTVKEDIELINNCIDILEAEKEIIEDVLKKMKAKIL